MNETVYEQMGRWPDDPREERGRKGQGEDRTRNSAWLHGTFLNVHHLSSQATGLPQACRGDHASQKMFQWKRFQNIEESML